MKKPRAKSSAQTAVLPPSDGAIRVSDKIVRELQSIIDHGDLKPGALLPSERELASRFWVSRSSVREALSIVETLGLVAIEPGRRARVLGTSTEPDKRLTRWHYASRFNESDVYELRLVLESRAARLAAEKVTPQTIADLTRSLAAMKDYMREGDLLAAAHEDFKFHDIIVVLSGNRLFAEIHHLNQE